MLTIGVSGLELGDGVLTFGGSKVGTNTPAGDELLIFEDGLNGGDKAIPVGDFELDGSGGGIPERELPQFVPVEGEPVQTVMPLKLVIDFDKGEGTGIDRIGTITFELLNSS